MSEEPNHPFIGYLVGNLGAINQCLVSRNVTTALELMDTTLMSLKPVSWESKLGVEIQEDLQKYVIKRATFTGHPTVMQRKQDGYDLQVMKDYKETFKKLTRLLWEGKYLTNEGYAFKDLTEGKPRR